MLPFVLISNIKKAAKKFIIWWTSETLSSIINLNYQSLSFNFSFAGLLYSVFLDGEVLSPFARLLQGNLGPQGVLNNCVRWIRQLVLPVVARIGLNFAFMPNETRDEFNEKGLSAFAELQFQEDFALDNMIKTIIGNFQLLTKLPLAVIFRTLVILKSILLYRQHIWDAWMVTLLVYCKVSEQQQRTVCQEEEKICFSRRYQQKSWRSSSKKPKLPPDWRLYYHAIRSHHQETGTDSFFIIRITYIVIKYRRSNLPDKETKSDYLATFCYCPTNCFIVMQ